MIVPPTPKGKRGGGIIAQEDGRWIVTLITHFGDYASPDLDGFIAFAKTLPVLDIYNVIRDAEPIGGPETIRIPTSVWHRYERLARFPPVISSSATPFQASIRFTVRECPSRRCKLWNCEHSCAQSPAPSGDRISAALQRSSMQRGVSRRETIFACLRRPGAGRPASRS